MNIDLEWKYLKYDIDSETWKAARVHITDKTDPEIMNEAQSGTDQLDVDYCIRKCNQGVSNLLDVIHKFVTVATTDQTNTLDRDTTKWTISITFDGRRNIDSKALANTFHNYVVLNVLQEWAKMAIPDMENTYVQRMAEERLKIQRIVYRKEAPVLDSTTD